MEYAALNVASVCDLVRLLYSNTARWRKRKKNNPWRAVTPSSSQYGHPHRPRLPKSTRSPKVCTRSHCRSLPGNARARSWPYRVAVGVGPRHVGPVEDVPAKRRSHGGAVIADSSPLVQGRVRGSAKSRIVDEDAPDRAAESVGDLAGRKSESENGESIRTTALQIISSMKSGLAE